MLTAEQKAAWLLAIKNDKAPRSINYFRKNNSFCVIGHGLNVLRPFNGEWKRSTPLDVYSYAYVSPEYGYQTDCVSILNGDLREFFGLNSRDITLLASMNDTGDDKEYLVKFIEDKVPTL